MFNNRAASDMQRFLATIFMAALNAYLYMRHPGLVRLVAKSLGYWPNLANPGTYNEKVNWRKIFDRNPLFVERQDKLAARKFVASTCPELNLPEILWIGTSPHDIPFDRIDRPVVIKANHGCDYNFFVRDPANIDRLEIQLFFTRILSERWGAHRFEWSYEGIQPCIYMEELLQTDDAVSESDYKIHVFDGFVAYSHIVNRRPGGTRKIFFNSDGELLPVSVHHWENTLEMEKTPLHEAADRYAARLCEGFDALRADFYIHKGKIYFGEFTIYPNSGLTPYYPQEFDTQHGSCWDIRKSYYFASRPSSFRRCYRRCLNVLNSSPATGPMASAPASQMARDSGRESV